MNNNSNESTRGSNKITYPVAYCFSHDADHKYLYREQNCR